MKVRKLKRKRLGVTAGATHLSSDKAARLLRVSHAHFDMLVRAGELAPIRHTPDGRQWFSTSQLMAYKKRSQIQRREGLTRMMRATRRMGFNDAELKGLPRR